MADEPEHKGHEHPDLSHLPSDAALRVRALESLLIEKGLARAETIDEYVEKFENEVGPHNGARVVARSWVDAAFRDRLLDNATTAIEDMGVLGAQTTDVVAVENSDEVHNLVVCTLCSCYPWTLLGIPPSWYKSKAYRSRVVREPRAVLQEFGVDLADNTEVRVWDSTAEVRYLVIPQRPAGTENMNEEELATIVSRDSMIGAAQLEV